jgi:protein subunit release factor B
MQPGQTIQSAKDDLRRRMERLKIDPKEIEQSFSRSSGPGGQNVNKVSTAVTIRYGEFSVTAQDSRSQAQNRQLAMERLLEAIEEKRRAERLERRSALEKIRRQNRKRPRGVKERILKSKKHRGDIKKMRKAVD